MKLNRSDIYEMVKSCLTMINEITSASAYERFYQDKIPQEKFLAFMGGQTDMTPFHKLILDLYAKGIVDDKVLTEAGNIWKNASNTAKQYIITWAKEDSERATNGESVINALNKIANLKGHSDQEYIDLGHEVLYEDNNVLVTCTKSYTASCNKYGDSHWCTASDRYGEWDGFEQFGSYTGFGFLVQFIDKNSKPNDCYQAEFSEKWDSLGTYTPSCICNWFDKEANIQDITNMLSKNGIDYSELYSKYIQPNAQRLRDETHDNYFSETEFYNARERIKRKRLFKKVKGFLESKDTMNKVIAKVKTMLANKCDYERNDGIEIQIYEENNLVRNLNINTNNDNYVVGVIYLGDSAAEEGLIQKLYDDYDYDATDNISRVLILDKNLNIMGKYKGFINPDFEKTGNLTAIDCAAWPYVIVSTITGKPVFTKYIEDFDLAHVDKQTGKVVVTISEENGVSHIFDDETAQEIRTE